MDEVPAEAFLAAMPAERRRVAERLRDVVLRAVPDAIERVRPGWGLLGYDVPFGRRTRYFAFIWAEPEHVHLGFEHGIAMDDPDGVLGGAGLRQVRFVTLVRGDEVPEATLVALVREGARVASMSRAERATRVLDRDR